MGILRPLSVFRNNLRCDFEIRNYERYGKVSAMAGWATMGVRPSMPVGVVINDRRGLKNREADEQHHNERGS
jgi:hypothetical protein